MKFKTIPDDYFATILDRLTRFEPACVRYKRVIDDILNKFLINPKKQEFDLEKKLDLACDIFNSSLNSSYSEILNLKLSDIFCALEEKYFNFNEVSYQYLSIRFNYIDAIKKIKNQNLDLKNLIWLKTLCSHSDIDIYSLRNKFSLLYPIEKIILCEGETERILLNTLLDIFDLDLNSKGIKVIAAGGKNAVARKYYSMTEYTKLPFFILLDKDAGGVKSLIEPKLRKNDRIYLLKSGEFEDLIPKNVLKNVINFAHNSEFHCSLEDFSVNYPMSKNIELIYKKYGFGEFKKAHFAQDLKNFILMQNKNKLKLEFEKSEIKEIAGFLT